ncbi:hypothetical protein LCGC14_2093640, partial [marine sediment metagenome]
PLLPDGPRGLSVDPQTHSLHVIIPDVDPVGHEELIGHLLVRCLGDLDDGHRLPSSILRGDDVTLIIISIDLVRPRSERDGLLTGEKSPGILEDKVSHGAFSCLSSAESPTVLAQLQFLSFDHALHQGVNLRDVVTTQSLAPAISHRLHDVTRLHGPHEPCVPGNLLFERL